MEPTQASIFDNIKQTNQRLKSDSAYVIETPLELSDKLSQMTGVNVYLKCEHVQRTGSFKFRGALNKILLLSEEQRKNGVIAASTGNHGLGVSLAAKLLNVPAIIYVPENASPMKLEKIQLLGAEVIKVSGDCFQAEVSGRKEAEDSGKIFISPYNDYDVIAGQGTIGVELLQQCKNLDAVFISVGGGGLISGIGAYLKHINPKIEIFGCWSENSPIMYECLKAGKIIEVLEKDTLSDATSGGLESNSVTLPICEKVIDSKVLVSEREIAKAIRLLATIERWIIEGAAGLAMACLIKEKEKLRGKNVAVVLCGRNIAMDTYLGVMNAGH